MKTAVTAFQGILTVLAAAFLLPAAASAKDEPKGDRERGESLYSRYCRGCHGEEGKGDGLVFMPHVDNLTKKGYIEKLPWLGVSRVHELVTALAHEIVGINLPTAQPMETANDLTTTPASLTNFHNDVSRSH